METLPVTLIVKAPNQQIEDQTIQCELSWTINKLKQHISEVYPSKPPKEEQKLIYSGQLLNDNSTLKDVLRQYEGQETHTVHLVCTFKKEDLKSPPTAPQNAPQNTPRENLNTAPQMNIPQPAWVGGYNNGAPMDPTQYLNQMAMMQQAYVQYLNQYMQLATSYGPPHAPGPIPQQQAPIQPEVQPEANPAVPAPPEAPQGGPAPQGDAPEPQERDWLDHFYLISRMLVFISVVYFYSSLLRFTFVLVLGAGVYLYQIGFFRNMNNNNNNNEGANQEEQVPSRFTVVWTFFTTFFASLLPEIPNAV